jgi:ParB family transcriptional regulator, chromosome partitioning protein
MTETTIMLAAQLLDPGTIQAPPFLRFRSALSFSDGRFQALKQSILHTAGNVQPIKVSRIAATTGSTPDHQLVFGSLRVQACLEIGLPILAIAEDGVPAPRFVTELDAFNDDVSLYERGTLYNSALDAGLYPSRRRLAEAIGRNLADVSLAMSVAQLPAALLACLRDPRALTALAAKRLTGLVTRDPEAANRRIALVRASRPPTDRAVLQALLNVDAS